MRKTSSQEKQKEIEKNIMFVSTIYDSFEALEETLGKLKLEQPLFITHVAKKAFAAEVLKYADQNPQIYAGRRKTTGKMPLYATPQDKAGPSKPLLH